ncbi:hypothetical protein SUGI_0174400 [Cryptomeria japonica]|nr:hypothetical protein SUGI_0174400 [Cryptomeria japonica]
MGQKIYVMFYDWYIWITWALSAAIILFLGQKTLWGKGRDGDDSSVNNKNPPGSTGLRFVGETISFLRAANSPLRRKFIDEHELTYGPIFKCNLFGKAKAVVSVDPEFNKYVLQNEGRLFQSKVMAPTRNLLGKYGLPEVHGELQKKIHGTAVNFFRFGKLGSDYMDDIQKVFLAEMSKWEDQRDIPLEHKCHEMGLKVIGKILLDLPSTEEMKDIYKAFHDFTEAILSLPLNIPGTSYYRGIQARKFLIKKIYECMEERRGHPDMKLYQENPRALEELRAEHDDIIKSKGKHIEKLTWDDYESMKFTHCVINETLRLASAAPCLFRQTIQDVKVKDYVIPKGWMVFVLIVATNLDEKYYYEADKFYPWRWQNEELFDKPFYMPFGGGSRLCPGLHLGKFEIALFLHYFLTKFRWEPLGVDHATYFPLPSMSKGFPIRLYPRLKNEE